MHRWFIVAAAFIFSVLILSPQSGALQPHSVVPSKKAFQSYVQPVRHGNYYRRCYDQDRLCRGTYNYSACMRENDCSKFDKCNRRYDYCRRTYGEDTSTLSDPYRSQYRRCMGNDCHFFILIH